MLFIQPPRDSVLQQNRICWQNIYINIYRASLNCTPKVKIKSDVSHSLFFVLWSFVLFCFVLFSDVTQPMAVNNYYNLMHQMKVSYLREKHQIKHTNVQYKWINMCAYADSHHLQLSNFFKMNSIIVFPRKYGTQLDANERKSFSFRRLQHS